MFSFELNQTDRPFTGANGSGESAGLKQIAKQFPTSSVYLTANPTGVAAMLILTFPP
jgi:hypothetical protein